MTTAMMQAEGEARRALAAYHEGSGLALAYPVDPVEIARSLGINVYSSPLPNSLSGMIARMQPNMGVDMFLNNQHAPVRQRFTCAHELGHYFSLKRLPDFPQRTFIHKRDQLASCGTQADEIFANQFAAELLMPREEVRRLTRMGVDEVALARRFNVSVDAMLTRLKNV